MAFPTPLDVLRIPSDVLIVLDNRAFHFALQPYHYLVRSTHIVSVAGFFGGIALLDLRLMGVRNAVPLRAFAEHVLPWLYGAFGVAVISGAALFFYDPLHVGAHAYFTLKLVFIVLGLANAALFHRTAYVRALAAETIMPKAAKIAGAVSLVFWLGVMICASLNVEAAPRVLLQ
jgi:hypothetical protein